MKTNLKVSLENIIPLTEARDHFSQIVAEVQRDKLYVLTKGGKPAVAIIDVKYLERITGGQVKPEQVEAEIQKDPAKVGRPVMLNHSEPPKFPNPNNFSNPANQRPNFSQSQNNPRPAPTQPAPIKTANSPIVQSPPPVQTRPSFPPTSAQPSIPKPAEKPITPPPVVNNQVFETTPKPVSPATPPATAQNPWNNLNKPTPVNNQTPIPATSTPTETKPVSPTQNSVNNETVFKPNTTPQTTTPPPAAPHPQPPIQAPTTQTTPAQPAPVSVEPQPPKPTTPANQNAGGAFIDVIASPEETETTPKATANSDDRPGPAQYSGENSKDDVEDMALD
jgi:prevent-host-death family protein